MRRAILTTLILVVCILHVSVQLRADETPDLSDFDAEDLRAIAAVLHQRVNQMADQLAVTENRNVDLLERLGESAPAATGIERVAAPDFDELDEAALREAVAAYYPRIAALEAKLQEARATSVDLRRRLGEPVDEEPATRGPAAQPRTGAPSRPEQRQATLAQRYPNAIIVDQMDGRNDTEKIDNAQAMSNRTNRPVVFSPRTYEYSGQFNTPQEVYWVGTPGRTVIRRTGSYGRGFEFRGRRTYIEGITFDCNQLARRALRLHGSGGQFHFKDVVSRGAHQQGAGLAAAVSIEDSPREVLLEDCVIADVSSDMPTGVRGNTPTVRGLYITANSGIIKMIGGQISGVGDTLVDRNGRSIWDPDGRHGGGLGRYDADAVVLQSGKPGPNREIHFIGVTFTDTPKRFIKGNDHVGAIFIEDCIFHVRRGTFCNQPIIFQGDHGGYDINEPWYHGHIKNTTFRYDRGEDFILRGRAPGVVQFDNNGRIDRFIAENNHLEIGDRSETHEGRGMFSFAPQANGAVHNITLRNNTMDVPQGLTYFVVIRSRAVGSIADARRRGVHNLVIRDNHVGPFEREAIRISNQDIDCDKGEMFSFTQIRLQGNTFTAPPGNRPWEQSDVSLGSWCPDYPREGQAVQEEQYQLDITVTDGP